MTTESRGGLIENRHYGIICVAGRDGVTAQAGNSEAVCFFRSAAKPIQVLPFLLMGLDKKYGLTDAECAIMAGSNAGEPSSAAVVSSLMKKAGVTEEDLVLGARYPSHPASRDAAIRDGYPPKKIWHGCAPKHVCAMLLQRELTGSVAGYHLPESAAQRMILSVLSVFTHTPCQKIALGTDGCGVPVFGVRADRIAKAYYHLACPDTLGDRFLAAATERITSLMHRYPALIRGNGYLCTALNQSLNLVAKGGASGVYAFGLKKERLGVMIKLIDGTETSWQVLVRELLKELSPVNSAETIATLTNETLIGTVRRELTNAAGETVGTMEPMFVLR